MGVVCASEDAGDVPLMGARFRIDGTVVCAAMHPAMPGDRYVDDQELHDLITAGDLVASSTHLHVAGCPGAFDCTGTLISASGVPVCGDGLWLQRGT